MQYAVDYLQSFGLITVHICVFFFLYNAVITRESRCGSESTSGLARTRYIAKRVRDACESTRRHGMRALPPTRRSSCCGDDVLQSSCAVSYSGFTNSCKCIQLIRLASYVQSEPLGYIEHRTMNANEMR